MLVVVVADLAEEKDSSITNNKFLYEKISLCDSSCPMGYRLFYRRNR